jgi:thiamine-phosphate pyrophosphorylase
VSESDESASRTLAEALRLVYVVDRRTARDWRLLDAAAEGGVTMVWLREPGASGAELYRSAKDLAWRTRERGIALLVGDRADVAMAVGAQGVQLGVRSPPTRRIRPWFPRWIGESCHSEAELRAAKQGGADFAVLSPLFGVPRKGEPLGLALFARLRAVVDLPVVALGGIDPESAGGVRAAGADGIAVIRAIRDADDPAEAARLLAGAVTPR